MKFKAWTTLATTICTASLVAACGKAGEGSEVVSPTESASVVVSESPPTTAVANLQTVDGKPAGTATITSGAEGLQLSLRVESLPAGEHGVHVHMVGKCDAPTFESAGGHLNPGNKQHGMENPQGQHVGDMPNLTVGDDGRGMLTYQLKGGTIEALLDADGSAMVVHANADDYKTDPSGNSGDRIACGVFSPG